ncbi:class I SAM-dependent methyltransferase [Flavobacteriaceae bacterium]|nr:class I SAM-dependent methyltransferase [Flavobacteriaceae bacterium]MDB0022687.1 class I SAM-dependent methyltransferase [Flavobacteriaceae bacterium]MDB3875140.1 class I SAM-dependent methyltransferase [Flavobacteriaceae bacterium]MDB9847036.1 class I SAM-dependent methyltransferase [Flavobacteriaceae bacterium]MDC0554303.1 class I SAM-dependent methyltransferase [Flavobacteriaceae bacterium]
MKNLTILILLISVILQSNDCIAQNSIVENKYIFKEGDFNGIGKWYMGREIAYVMGYQGIGWLERSEREKEENVSKLIKNMRIKPNDFIADIGAGSGYHAFRMASLAPNGLVYAVDIQTEMLMAIENKKTFSENSNIETILGTEKTVELPKNSVDKILMVDVYHEFSFPIEMIASMKSALKSNGELFLIEYRAEDPLVPIKTIHKMSEKQAIKEMEAAGFKLRKNIDNLPWQHCMIFVKNN